MKKKKVAFHNLGCKVNAYETEAMQQLLKERGFEVVPFEAQADVYIINTCAVTNIADRKSRQMLHRARKKNPQAVIVAAGCYAQAAQDKLLAERAADLVIGNNRKKDLADILDGYLEQGRERESKPDGCYLCDIAHAPDYETLSIDQSGEHTRAYIKVQDGCNQFCSYCIIPYTRGRVRSREISDVVSEAARLAESGCREVVLTGIHLSSYGMEKKDGTGLLQLIEAVHGVGGIRRIRLGSLEPRIITEEFANTLSKMPKVCPHFHLSLQSGCDETLRRMNRHYTTQEYYEKCEILRRCFDHPALTTDVIVGFPGETEEEFARTKAFLEKVKFYETHIFKYSRREGTRAAQMSGQVSEQTKNGRSRELLDLNEKNKAEYEAYFCGKHAEVLFEKKETQNGREYYTGHTREYILMRRPAGKEDLRNKICDCILEHSDVE